MDLREECWCSLTRVLMALVHPSKNHSSRRLRDGSSGGDHSKPSSSTALDRTWKRWVSMPELDVLGCADCKRRGRETSPTAPPHLKPPMTGCHPSRRHRFHWMRPDRSQPQGWAKRTGETSLWGESEARGGTAGVSSLVSELWDPLPRSFFLTGSWEEKSGRAQGAESVSEKKANRERREAKLISPQWGHSVSVSAVSAWVEPKHETHSPCLSAPCRATKTVRHLQQRRRNLLFRNMLWRESNWIAAGNPEDQLLQMLSAAVKRRSQLSRERSGSAAMARLTAKASSLVERRSCSGRWRRRNLRILWQMHALYSQMPRPFWRALAGFWTNGRAVRLRYWKGFSYQRKRSFPLASLNKTQYEVKYR